MLGQASLKNYPLNFINMNKLNKLALGYTGATISAVLMLVMGVLTNLGVYEKASDHMSDWHLFYSPSFFGIIGGMIEAAVVSFIFFYIFAVLYNKFSTK